MPKELDEIGKIIEDYSDLSSDFRYAKDVLRRVKKYQKYLKDKSQK